MAEDVAVVVVVTEVVTDVVVGVVSGQNELYPGQQKAFTTSFTLLQISLQQKHSARPSLSKPLG